MEEKANRRDDDDAERTNRNTSSSWPSGNSAQNSRLAGSRLVSRGSEQMKKAFRSGGRQAGGMTLKRFRGAGVAFPLRTKFFYLLSNFVGSALKHVRLPVCLSVGRSVGRTNGRAVSRSIGLPLRLPSG